MSVVDRIARTLVVWPLVMLVMASPAIAAPVPPQVSDGIEMVRIGDRDYPRLRVSDGRWWYVAPSCPWPSPQVPGDAVCGGEQVVLRDDHDLRCTFVHSYRAELTPPRATWRFCLTRPPLSPAYLWTEEQNSNRINQLRNAVGSCPDADTGCMPMQRWPRAAEGTIDCAAVPRDQLGESLAAASSTDPAVVDRVCAVLNAYLTGRSFPTGMTAAELNLAGRAVADGVPMGTSTAPGDTVVDWGKVGDSLEALCATQGHLPSLGALCGGKSVVEAGLKLWGVMDCATEFDKCLAEAAARAMLTGLELTLGALRQPTGVDFDEPGLRSILGALGTVSAYLVLLFLLVNAVVAAVRMRTRELAEGGLGVVRWAFGLGVGLTLVSLAIFVSDRVADWFADETAGTSEAVYVRFFVLMHQLVRSDQITQTTGWLLVMVVFLVGAVAAGVAYLLLVFRKGAIVLAVAVLVLQLAGGAGPRALRKWPRKGLSVLWACVIAKPLTVVVFRLGESWIGAGRGLGDLLIGVGTLGVAAFAPFVVVKWFPLDGDVLGAGRGSMAMSSATVLAMLATRTSSAVPSRAEGTAPSGDIPANRSATTVLPSQPASANSGSAPPQRRADDVPAGQVESVRRDEDERRSGLANAAIAGVVVAVGGQVAMDGVTSGGAIDSPYPDQLPYLPYPSHTSARHGDHQPAPPQRRLGPAENQGRW
ncbi:hypothetical protein AB0A74_03200 [Saccharothrix sp. NPDC042600]|uniref:hypothetical protein n=1 Tax=Saccharothrix TaxID=2071 RepID=UPI0033F0C5E2|nr:hypothetical protein GCM10017745_67840 [Saccharothrix mutabilis subsp. capreolus]